MRDSHLCAVANSIAVPADLPDFCFDVFPQGAASFGSDFALIDKSVDDDPKHVDGNAGRKGGVPLERFDFGFECGNPFGCSEHPISFRAGVDNRTVAEGGAA